MNYKITEKNGTYTAELPLAMVDGRTLIIRSSANVADTYRELGLNPAIEGVGWNPFKAIGKIVKKITKNKVFKKVIGVAKDVLKSPITTAALGAVTGGAAIAPLAAANMAIRLTEEAVKTGKKADAARKLLKASVRAAGKEEAVSTRIEKVKDLAISRNLLTPEKATQLAARQMRLKLVASKQGAQAAKSLPPKARAVKFLVDIQRV
jgi:hypothetical protein